MRKNTQLTRLVVSMLLIWLLLGLNCYAQKDEMLRNTTAQRGLAVLLEAIDKPDNGNADTVALRGLLPSGSESHSVFLQIASDDRVRKIFSLLQNLPKSSAASIVSNSYTKSLRKLKALAQKGKGDRALRYGLHAKLWLCFEFGSREDFNRHYNDWNNWFVEDFGSKKYLERNGKVPEQIRKYSFASSSAPETLMYLNLALIDHSRNGGVGNETEFGELLSEARLHHQHSYGSVPILPYDVDLASEQAANVEPLLTIPMFSGWGGLDDLNIEERLEFAYRTRAMLERKGKFEGTLEELALALLSLGGRVDLKSLQGKEKSAGTAIVFLHSEVEKKLIRGWYADRPPTKQQLMSAVDQLFKQTPPDERDEWQVNVDHLQEWLSKVPESGLIANKVRVFEWPEPKTNVATSNQDTPTTEGDTLSGQRTRRIRLVLKKTKTLTGKLDLETEKSESQNTDTDKCEEK